MKGLCIWLGFMAVSLAGPAAAQSPQGLLNAISFERIPAGTAITVNLLDNSDANLALQREFESDLRAAGYTVAKDAPLVLTFSTRDVAGAYLAGDPRHIIELSGTTDRGANESARARVNIFDSAGGGLINAGNDSSNTTIVTPPQYRMDATLDSRDTGHRLWQAWATANLDQSSGRSLTAAMVPVIIRHLGRTVRQMPFPVP